MSSLRNVIKRRIHLERGQPSERRKLGLLEKKKDYKERAKDFHRKQDTIRRLREKAALKNPDEFYYKMTSSQTKDGKHIISRGTKRSADELRTIKSQDVGYLTTKQQHEAKKIQRLEGELQLLDAKPPPRRHVVLVDEPAQAEAFTPEEYFDTVPELSDRTFNRLKKSQLEAGPITTADKPQPARLLDKEQKKRYEELSARIERKEKIDKVLSKLQQQKLLMGKGVRKKVAVQKDIFGEEIAETAVFKWKLERKK